MIAAATNVIGAHLAIEPYLSRLPTNWDASRFKNVLRRQDQRNKSLDVPMYSLRSTGDVVPRRAEDDRQRPSDSSLPNYLVADIGDLVVNPMWLVGGGIGVTTERCAVSPDYRVFRPTSRLDPQYLHYLLRSQPLLDQYALYTRAQTTFDRRVQQGDLDNMPVLIPPLAQQRAIANYITRETAQIDTLVEEQQSLQSLLAERRGTLIDEALFDSCASKDSVPLKRMIRAVEQGVSPQAEGRLAQEPGSWGVLKSGCVNRGQFRPEEHKRLDDDFRFDQRLEVKAGDLLVSRASGSPDLVGSAGIVTPSKYRLILSDKTFRLVPEDPYSVAYLHLLLNSSRYREQVKAALSGADGLANNLPLSRLLNMRFPVLMGQAQAETVQRVVSELSKIDRTLSEVEKFVALTRERRAALITAAVTGAVDVETI